MNTYETITNRIIEELENGRVPWRKDWQVNGSSNGGKPTNKLTGKVYRGINFVSLLCSSYGCNEWLTYKQAQELGGNVRKGERGSPIVFWSTFAKDKTTAGETDAPDTDGNAERGARGFLKTYYVFNLDQIDGLTGELPLDSRPEFEPVERAESIAAGFLSSGGPSLAHGGSRAFYAPSRDAVQMPHRADFNSADGYYSTLFHEFSHATGHQTRLDRKGITDSMGFGSKGYASEELLAEFGAGFLCGEAGISNDRLIENQAAYIRNWLDVLKGDSKVAIFAAQRAQKAADFILQRSSAIGIDLAA